MDGSMEGGMVGLIDGGGWIDERMSQKIDRQTDCVGHFQIVTSF